MKTEIKYGVIFAAIVIVWVMFEHVMGYNSARQDIGEYTRLAGILIPIIGVFFGIKAKRDKDLAGAMTWGQGVKAGAAVAIVQTTITTLWFLIYALWINPQFMETMLAFERSKMLAAGTATAEVDASIAMMSKFYALPYFQMFQEAFGIISGVVFAIIFSLFLKRRAR
jgi:hypothetical protein